MQRETLKIVNNVAKWERASEKRESEKARREWARDYNESKKKLKDKEGKR